MICLSALIEQILSCKLRIAIEHFILYRQGCKKTTDSRVTTPEAAKKLTIEDQVKALHSAINFEFFIMKTPL